MATNKNLEVTGNILDHPPAELFAEIAQANLSGSIRFSHAEQKIIIYFDGGEAVFAVSNARTHRLFHILLRETLITPAQLAEIPNFSNDQELKINLIKKQLFNETDLNAAFSLQVREILRDALAWREGGWMFSPLVRIKGEIRFPADLADMLFSYARKVPPEHIVRRFKSLQEGFASRAEIPAHINLLPQEAFVYSRLDGAACSIEEIKSLSGLSEAETLKSLYILWLGGFLVRRRWNSAFSQESLSAILSARFEIKSKSFTPQTVPEKAAEEKLPVPETIIEDAPEAVREISVEEYLERIEKAVTHYEILDIAVEADSAQIKAAYFQLAKRFHPDLFYRRVADELHRRVQNAFTELAQAYETLRNKESREVYDFKLRKEIADFSKRGKSAESDAAQSPAQMLEEQAAENFDHGYDLLMEDEYEEAAPYLARAAHLAGGNARYRAYFGKALAYSKETYRQAESEFQAALRIEPDNLDYRLMLADLFMKIGLSKRAEGELKRILEKSPNHHEARSLLDSLHNK